MPETLPTETSERRQSRGSVAEEIPPPSASAFTGSASGLRHPAPRTEGTVSAGFRLHLTQVGTGCKHRNNKQPASSVNEQGGGLHDGMPPSSHLCFRTTAGHWLSHLLGTPCPASRFLQFLVYAGVWKRPPTERFGHAPAEGVTGSHQASSSRSGPRGPPCVAHRVGFAAVCARLCSSPSPFGTRRKWGCSRSRAAWVKTLLRHLLRPWQWHW